jgi:RNA polymerase sigma factor (sigma-70 family)
MEVEAQDVVQETMFAVAKHMPSFKYDPTLGSFKAWLLNMTRWRIIDQLRKRGPVAPRQPSSGETAAHTGTVEKVVDPASARLEEFWETEWERTVLEAAIVGVKRRLDPERYQIFDCYVNKEWAPEKVAKTFGISVDQVYLAKHRVTEMIKIEAKRLEKEMT